MRVLLFEVFAAMALGQLYYLVSAPSVKNGNYWTAGFLYIFSLCFIFISMEVIKKISKKVLQRFLYLSSLIPSKVFVLSREIFRYVDMNLLKETI